MVDLVVLGLVTIIAGICLCVFFKVSFAIRREDLGIRGDAPVRSAER